MARLKPGEVVDLVIDSLAYGGRGVARRDGLVVMVDGAFPGDRVRARITRVRRALAEARTEEVLEPGPVRVTPFCVHAGVCGGCRLQAIAYARQVELKAGQVEEALRRIGGFPDPPLEPAIEAPATRYYRNKMEFSFGPGDDGQIQLGLHPAGDFRRVFALEWCHLLSERSNAIVAAVIAAARRSGLPAYDQRLHQGFFRFLTVREGKNTGQTMIILTTTDGDDASRQLLREWGADLRERFPEIRSVLRQVNSRLAGVAAGEYEEVLAGERTIEEILGGFRFEVSARAFFQTNTLQAERLYGKVLEYAAPSGDGVALDLYCGTGTISLLLSRAARRVYGVESNPDAVANAVRNARLNGVEGCEFVQGEVTEVIERTPLAAVQPEVAVINPPRAGMHPALVRRLIRVAIPRLVYVSCNPTTLARDLALLVAGGYRFVRAVPVDMFPHTAHIESVALLEQDAA
jgi:23S rRNA (uracil1939-C5)-methyltransferase